MESSQAADLNRETERFRNLTLSDEKNAIIEKLARETRKGGIILIEPLRLPQKPEKPAKKKKKKEAKTSSRKNNPCAETDNAMEGDVEMKQSSHVPTTKKKKAHKSRDRESRRDKSSGSSGRKNQTNQNLSENSVKPNPRGNGKGPRIKVRSSSASSVPSKSHEIRDNLKFLFNYKNSTIPKVKNVENTNQNGSDDNDDSPPKTKKMVSPLEGLYPPERLEYGLRFGQYSVEELIRRLESDEEADENNTDAEQQKNWDFLNQTTKIDEIYKSLTVESQKDEKAEEAKRKEKSKTNKKKELTRPKKPTTKNINKKTVNGESEGAVISPKQTVSEDRNENVTTEENVACPIKIVNVRSIKSLMTTAAQKTCDSVKNRRTTKETRRSRKREAASKSLSSASKKRNNSGRKMSRRSKSEGSENRTRTESNTDQAPEPESVNADNQTLAISVNVEVNNNSPQPSTSQQETIADVYDWMNPNNTNDENMEENGQTLTSVMNSDDDRINDVHATGTGPTDSIGTTEIDNSSNSFNATTMNLRICEPTELVENVNDNEVYSAFDEGAGNLLGDEDGQGFDGEEDRLFGDEDGSAYYENTGHVSEQEDEPKVFAEGQNPFEEDDGPKVFEETGGLAESAEGTKFYVGPDLFEEEDGPKISTVIGNSIEGGLGQEFYEGAGNLNENNDGEEIFGPNGEEEPGPAENPNRGELNATKKKRGRKKKPGTAKKKGLKGKARTNNRVKQKRTETAKPVVRVYRTRKRYQAEVNLGNPIDLLEEIEEEIEESGIDNNEVDEDGKPISKVKMEVQKLREGLYSVFKKPNNQKSRSPSPNAETDSHEQDLPTTTDRKRSADTQGDDQASDIEQKRARKSSDETENLNSESQESNNEQRSAEADSSYSERNEQEVTQETSTTARDLNSESQESNNEQRSAEPASSYSESNELEEAIQETSTMATSVNENQNSYVEEGRAYKTPYNLREFTKTYQMRGCITPYNLRTLGNGLQKSNIIKRYPTRKSSRDDQDSDDEQSRAGTESENEDQNADAEQERAATEPEKEDQNSDAEQERAERESENKDQDSNAEQERAAIEPENEDQNSDAEERTTETVRCTLSVGTTSNIGKKSARNKAGKQMTGPRKTGRVSSVENANVKPSPNMNPKVVLDKLNLKTFDRDEIISLARDIQYRQKNGMKCEQQSKGAKRSQHKKQKKKQGGRPAREHRLDPGGVPTGIQREVENRKEDQDEEQDKEVGTAERIKSYLERNVRKAKRLKCRGSKRGYVGKKITEACFRVFLPPYFTSDQRKRKISDEMREQHLNNKKKRVPVRNETATDSESVQWLKSYSLLNYSFRKSQKLYRCLLCPKVTGFITSHYKLIHRESEVLISRLSRKEASDAVEDAIAEGVAHEVENITTQARLQFCVYTCRMCDIRQMTTFRDFFVHVTTHTGEYNLTYPTGPPISILSRSGLTTENIFNSVEYEPLYGFICSRCNYVQVFRKNVEDHVKRKHKDDRNISIIKINLSSKESLKQTNDAEQNRSTTSEKQILPERQQQNEDDGAEVEYYGAGVEYYGAETENYGAGVEYYGTEVEYYGAEAENYGAGVEYFGKEVEYYGAEVQKGGAEAENYAAEVEYYAAGVEYYGAEVQNGGAEVRNGGAEVQNGGAEVQNGGAETDNYVAGVEYYGAEVQNGGAEVRNGGAEVRNGGAEVQNGGAEVQNGGAEVQNGGAEVQNGGAEAENYAAEVENNGEEVQNGERVEEESYSPKSPSPEPNGETFGLEMNEERAEHKDSPELINIADLPNSPQLVELDVDEEPKVDDTVDIKIELEIGPFERRKWVVGLLKAQILDDSDFLYDCLVKTCMFTTRVYSNFESHVRIMHSNTLWRGNCDACTYKAKPGETLTMLNALEHLTSHSRARRSRNMGLMNDDALSGPEIDSPEQQPVQEDSNNNTAQNHKASCFYAHECGSELCRHCIRGFCDERCFVIRQPPHGVKTYFCNFCTFKSALKKSIAKHVFSKHTTMMENALLEDKVIPDLDRLTIASSPVDNYQHPVDLYPNPNQDHSALQEFTIPNQNHSALQEFTIPNQNHSALQEFTIPNQDHSALQEFTIPNQDHSALQEFTIPNQNHSALQEFNIPNQDHSALQEFTIPNQGHSALQEFTIPNQNHSALQEFNIPNQNHSALQEFNIPNQDHSALQEFTIPNQNHSALQEFTIPNQAISAPQTITLNKIQDLPIQHNMPHEPIIPVTPSINFSEPIITQAINSYSDKEPLDLSQDHYKR